MPSRHSKCHCHFPVRPSFTPSSLFFYTENGAGLHGDTSANSEYVPLVRGPLDDKYIISLVLKQKKHLILAGFSLLVCSTCNLASPVISGILFEILTGRQPMSRYPYFLAAMATLYTVEPLLTRVYITNVCTAGEKVLRQLRMELFRTLLMQRVEFFDRHPTPELTALLSSDLDSLRSFVFSNVARDRGLRAILEAAGSVLVLFVLSWRLGPILALVIVATAGVVSTYRKQTKAVEAAAGNALSRMVAIADQAFRGITTVRSFAGEGLERERFGEHAVKSYHAGVGFAHAKANLESLNRAAIHASLIALYGLGGWLVSQGLMPLRVLLSAIGFTFSLVFATQGCVQTFSDAQRALVSLARIREKLAEEEPDPTMAAALPPGAWWAARNGAAAPRTEAYGPHAGNAAVDAARLGDLQLAHVDFSYPLRPEAPVLRDVSMTLPRGKVTAVVGHSGAGKSTIAALISRFYTPTSGDVLLAGQSAQSFSRGEWAKAVALVSQEPVLFSGTIADNIAYASYGNCSRAEVVAAAEAANAAEFIAQLPQGYDTLVGDRGALLSGGQRQRIAIARALLKDSPILVLDEATSALDTVSERLVQAAIDRLMAGRTVLVIAHRLSTIQAAEQIVVLDGGRVAEVGNHIDLTQRGGLYAKLVSTQSLSLSNV
ncbi:mitochondrial potassium channel ATP-binding subunit [Coccomyxa sp. Obi]|nr:mitochondrial potassium channel ATP-binding subunit [Coccomyxa sp. Obi]